MVNNVNLSPLTPHEAAKLVGAGVQSIRRWCDWHSKHISNSANPGPGIPRRLTRRDVEVLMMVKNLRYQGLQTEAINERLSELTFPEVDNGLSEENFQKIDNIGSVDSVDTAASSQDIPSALQSTQIAPVALEVVLSLQRQIEGLAVLPAKMEALEKIVNSAKQEAKQAQRDRIQDLMTGAVVALVFILIVLVLVDLWAK